MHATHAEEILAQTGLTGDVTLVNVTDNLIPGAVQFSNNLVRDEASELLRDQASELLPDKDAQIVVFEGG